MRRPHAAAADGQGARSSHEASLEAGYIANDDDTEKRLRGGGIIRRGVVLGGSLTLCVLGVVWLTGGEVAPSPSEAQVLPPLPPSSLSKDEPLFAESSTPAPAAPSPPSGSAKVEDEEAEMNAILDDLLDLHRKDVAQREGATVPPEDLPVSYSDDSLVVSMADGGYAACAIRLMESVRGVGRWGGPVAVLVPTGEGSLPLDKSAEERLKELGATLFPVAPEAAGGTRTRGAGSATQYGKVKLLTDVTFRRYRSILFLDADGLVGAPLQPLLELDLPKGRSVAMPTWPSVEAPKETFYAREIALGALSAPDVDALRDCCPDRLLVGITAWFLLKPDLLPSTVQMRSDVDAALERWRAAFRFNDQGLWNVLFYNVSAFYPLCLSGPLPGDRSGFRPLLVDNLDNLGAAIDSACGPMLARRRNLYAHPLKDCVPDSEWQRKMQANRELGENMRNDLNKAYDDASKIGRR